MSVFSKSSNSARLAAVCDCCRGNLWNSAAASSGGFVAVGEPTLGDTGEARVGFGGGGPFGREPNLLKSMSLLSSVLLPANSYLDEEKNET